MGLTLFLGWGMSGNTPSCQQNRRPLAAIILLLTATALIAERPERTVESVKFYPARHFR